MENDLEQEKDEVVEVLAAITQAIDKLITEKKMDCFTITFTTGENDDRYMLSLTKDESPVSAERFAQTEN